MSENTRTENSIRNSTMLFIFSIVFLAGGYAVRIVFTHVFTKQIVGVEGLFDDILRILALTEMGFESAITFALYKPVASGDIEKQKSIMRLFRTVYRAMAGIVFGLGMVIMFFLPMLTKDGQSVEHLHLYFFFYLLNSSLSYLVAYKRALIDAHQLIYLSMFYTLIALLLQDVLQIILLFIIPSYLIFLIIRIVATVLKNVFLNWKANQLYPYLKDKNIQPLSEEDRTSIVKNMRAMIYHKVGKVAVNNTDNLILSAFVGLAAVGMYSNYAIITNAVRNIILRVYRGVSASVGNFRVTESDDAVAKVFEMIFFLGAWMTCVSTTCLYTLLSAVVGLSFGDKYILEPEVVIVICLNFMVCSMGDTVILFRDSLGLFWHDRYKPVLEAVLNLVLSLIFVQYWGIVGVFMGTLISHLLSAFWIEPYVLYKHSLNRGCGLYFAKYIMYIIVCIGSAALVNIICKGFPAENHIVFILSRLPVSVMVPGVLFMACFFWTKEFKDVTNLGFGYIKKRIGKK